MSKMTIDEALGVADRWARETVITVGNNALPYACVELAAEVRRLREAKAQELAEKFLRSMDGATGTIGQAIAATEIRDGLRRWLETE